MLNSLIALMIYLAFPRPRPLVVVCAFPRPLPLAVVEVDATLPLADAAPRPFPFLAGCYQIKRQIHIHVREIEETCNLGFVFMICSILFIFGQLSYFYHSLDQ